MSLDVARIRALCFDIDGTLSDTDDQWVARFERLLRPARWVFPRRETRPFARWAVMGLESPGNLLYHLLDHWDLDDDVARLMSAVARRQNGRAAPKFWIIPRIKEALQTLHVHYPMSVVTARGDTGTRMFLEQFELQPFFKAVASSQTCRYTKPFPDPIIWAAEQMGVHPEECLMIGDTTVDILAGKAAGAQTIGVLCGFGRESELRRAGADLILSSPFDLPEVLLGS
jgi:phosphoglycolate phosphatase-like HAD superfamily hydrolase